MKQGAGTRALFALLSAFVIIACADSMMLPISNTHASPVDRESTPSPEEQRANPERDAFLSLMDRQDLVAVARFLDEQIGLSQWAFTGSTALSIHAQLAGKHLGREPGDVDVLVDSHRLNLFGTNKIPASWQKKGFDFHRDEEGQIKLHILTLERPGRAPLSIDLIENGKDKVFGTLADADWNLRAEHPISVLSTAALATSLKKRKDAGEAGDNTDHDIQFIASLSEPRPGASLNALLASPAGQLVRHVRRRSSPYTEPPGPGPSPKRQRGIQD